MANVKYSFDFKNKSILGNIRSPNIWQFNLAQNMALLSNDIKAIRYFYRTDARSFIQDSYISAELDDKFLGYYQKGQALVYFGLIPMIVNAVTNLVASSGFEFSSDEKEIDEKLDLIKQKNDIQMQFTQGEYYLSGLGDFAYRLSYIPELSNRPIIDLIEPQYLEVIYNRKKIRTIIVKEPTDVIVGLELHEVYSRNKEGYVTIDYFFYKGDRYISKKDDKQAYELFVDAFNLTEEHMKQVVLSLKEFPIIYVQNIQQNLLFKGQRGIPDIQGLDTIEDALSESVSDLIDAIRKAGIKEFIDESLQAQDADGNVLGYNSFNKRIIKVKGSSLDNKSLLQVVQGDINYDAYIETAKYLISVASNKVGISPTTLGITGLESINSSSESQDGREKPSMRLREEKLKNAKKYLTDLFNRYLQMCDYIDGEEVEDYTDCIQIKFNKYSNPAQENVVALLASKLELGLISQTEAIAELYNYSMEEAESKLIDILQEKSLMSENIPTLDEQPTEAINEEQTEPTTALNADERS